MSGKDDREKLCKRNQNHRNNTHSKDKNSTLKKTLRPSSNKVPPGILKESLEKITDYIINNLKDLNKSNLTDEDIILLLKITSKACDNDLVESKSNMLKCVMDPSFINKIRTFFSSMATIVDPLKHDVLHNVLTILENSIQLIPNNTCKGFVEIMVKNMLLLLPLLKGDWSFELGRVKTLKQELERLESLFYKPKLEATVETDDPVPVPSKDIYYFDLQKFECQDFTTPERSFVRRNIIKGPYNSVKEYLDIHFRLLREDFLSPIRKDLCDYLNHKNRRMLNTKVHKDVKFCKTKYVEGKAWTVLQFNLLESEQHKGFMCRSLLIFSNDGFKTLFTGKVMGTSDLLKGELDVEVYGDVDVFKGTFTMVECTVFFEPYFQVLSVLQKLETIPLERYIVNVETNVSRPKYIKKSYSHSLPSNLDPSQRAAMHAALNKELVVIQGPPGTGKTFLGMELVKLLLSIKNNVKLEGPILIVTYTNHALEEFLDGLEGYTKNISSGHDSNDMGSVPPGAEARCFMYKSLSIATDDGGDLDHFDNIEYELVGKVDEDKNAPHRVPLRDALPRVDDWRIHTTLYKTLKRNEAITEELRKSLDSKLLLHLGVFKSYDNIIILWWLMCNDGTVLPDKNFPAVNDECIFDVLRVISQLSFLKIGDIFHIESLRTVHEFLKTDDHRQLLKDFLSMEADFLEQCLNTDFGHTTDNIENYNDIFEIPCRTRWQIYQRMNNDKIKKLRLELLLSQERDRIGWERYSDLKQMNIAKLLKNMDILAMTTTQAAKMRSTLELIGCPIVLVEEAAEVLESHIISALTTECQHLILLGDHQQMRPSTAADIIGQKYNLGISLFERLIQNNIECHTLNVQHRMRPEISSLIHPLFYKELFNDRKVEEYPLVSGVKSPLYFIDHLEPEEPYGDSSKMNVYEAQFLLHLAIFLLNNNYEPEDITILATYSGQMYEMKKQQSLSKNEKLQTVSIDVVDNFQGKENKIILLSLVRNKRKEVWVFCLLTTEFVLLYPEQNTACT